MLNMTDTETLDRSMNLRPCLAVIWNLQVSLILKMIAGTIFLQNYYLQFQLPYTAILHDYLIVKIENLAVFYKIYHKNCPHVHKWFLSLSGIHLAE